MSNSRNRSVSLVVQSEQKRVDNLPTVLPKAVFIVGGQSLTTDEIVADYKQHITHEAQLVALRDQLRSAVIAIRVERKAMAANDAAVKATAAGTVGDASTAYASLGFAPRAARKPSVATKAVAIAKGAATRVARHTLGPSEKAKIHGTIPEPAPAPAPVTPSVVTK